MSDTNNLKNVTLLWETSRKSPWLHLTDARKRSSLVLSPEQFELILGLVKEGRAAWLQRDPSDPLSAVALSEEDFRKLEHLFRRNRKNPDGLWMIEDLVQWNEPRIYSSPFHMIPVRVLKKPEGYALVRNGQEWQENPVLEELWKEEQTGKHEAVPAHMISYLSPDEIHWLDLGQRDHSQPEKKATDNRMWGPLYFHDPEQEKAIQAAFEGKNLLIEGIRGSGKEEIISELLAQSVASSIPTLVIGSSQDVLDSIQKKLLSMMETAPVQEEAPVSEEKVLSLLEDLRDCEKLILTLDALLPEQAPKGYSESLLEGVHPGMENLTLYENLSDSLFDRKQETEIYEKLEKALELCRSLERRTVRILHQMGEEPTLWMDTVNPVNKLLEKSRQTERRLQREFGRGKEEITDMLEVFVSALEIDLLESLDLVEQDTFLAGEMDYEDIQRVVQAILEEGILEADRLFDMEKKHLMVLANENRRSFWNEILDIDADQQEVHSLMESLSIIVEKAGNLLELARNNRMDALLEDLEQLRVLTQHEGLLILADQINNKVLSQKKIIREMNRKRAEVDSLERLAEREKKEMEETAAMTGRKTGGLRLEDLASIQKELEEKTDRMEKRETVLDLVRKDGLELLKEAIDAMELEEEEKKQLFLYVLMQSAVQRILEELRPDDKWEDILAEAGKIHQFRKEMILNARSRINEYSQNLSLIRFTLPSGLGKVLQEAKPGYYLRVIIADARKIPVHRVLPAIQEASQVLVFSDVAKNSLVKEGWNLPELEEISLHDEYIPHEKTLFSFIHDHEEVRPESGVLEEKRSEIVLVPKGRMERGDWIRGNRLEAARVVDILLKTIESHPEEDVRILTFSRAQKEAVIHALGQRRKDSDLLEAYEERHGWIPVELVQENTKDADTIILSTGYSRDIYYRPATFGILEREPGSHLVSRAVEAAEKGIILVTSLTDADFAGKRAEGVLELADLYHVLKKDGRDDQMEKTASIPMNGEPSTRRLERILAFIEAGARPEAEWFSLLDRK